MGHWYTPSCLKVVGGWHSRLYSGTAGYMVAHKILETALSPNSSFPVLFDFGLRLRTWDLDSGLSIDKIFISWYQSWTLDYIEPEFKSSGLKMEVVFKRRIMNELLTTYLPSCLLLLICYSTTFFKPFYFEAQVTVNLSVMLVTTNLFIRFTILDILTFS